MPPFLFWIFAGITLLFALFVVLNRSPIASALCLVVSFLGLASLFVSLDAYFIGTIQVLVYAGAVMVLFLFIIMLLDLKAEARRTWNLAGVTGGVLVSVSFVWIVIQVLEVFPKGKATLPPLRAGEYNDVMALGMELFSKYNLPFQVIGVLLFVATVGVVLLSNRELK